MTNSKQPLVSIIVPTRNNGKTLKACLESIKQQSYEPIELIVVDRDSTDDTKKIAKRYTKHVFNHGPERCAQRNFGARKSNGKYIVMIDSDMELDKEVIKACLEKIQSDKKIKGVIIPEESFGQGFWAQCKRLERSFYVGVSWIEAARFFDKSAYDKIGGYDETMVSGEDWDLSKRIEEQGSIANINEFIHHNEGHINLWRTLKKKYYYAQHAKAYLVQNKQGSNLTTQKGPIQRYKLFFYNPRKLFKHPLEGTGMLFMKTTEFAAGGLGMLRSRKISKNETPQMRSVKIGMVCFGDLLNQQNGYTKRCWTMAKKQRKKGNNVTVYQYTNKDGDEIMDGVRIVSIKVKHESKNNKSGIGINVFRELTFPYEGFKKLKKYKLEIDSCDKIYIEGCLIINGFIFAKRNHKKIVLDTHCVNKDIAIKLQPSNPLIGFVRKNVWHVIEKSMMKRSDEIIAISEYDKKMIKAYYNIPDEKIVVIPHEVVPADKSKYVKLSKKIRKNVPDKFKRVAVFMGDLGAIQNSISENYIRENLAPAAADVYFFIVGRNPNSLRNQKNIIYTGFVDDFDPYIISSDVCIAPMQTGSGIKTKILDYLKYDKKIVATPVAMEGILPSKNVTIIELNEFETAFKKVIYA